MIYITVARTAEAINRMPTGVNQANIQSSMHTYPENQAKEAGKFIIQKAREGYSVMVTQAND